jgi:putative flippase GtrA
VTWPARWREASRFLVVGLAVTAVDFSITWLAVWVGLPWPWAVSLGYASGLVSGYVWHGSVSFRASLEPGRQIPRFAVLVVLNYMITLVVAWWLVDVLGVGVLLARVLGAVPVALNSYVLSRCWVYAASPPVSRQPSN